MVADLSKMSEGVLTRTPDGFVIREIANETELYGFKKMQREHPQALPD